MAAISSRLSDQVEVLLLASCETVKSDCNLVTFSRKRMAFVEVVLVKLKSTGLNNHLSYSATVSDSFCQRNTKYYNDADDDLMLSLKCNLSVCL